mmetsp:Transcript_58222/g.130217  ORF Transcript_58222/g.130217 Transcript_58222/m.130217 type:complete len:218 (+) Transcript_58222:53-706(+)
MEVAIPKVVVFDMGGVLGPDTDLRPIFTRAGPTADKDKIDKAFKESWTKGRISDKYDMGEFWAPILDAAGVSRHEWEEVDREVRQQFLAFWQILGVADRVCRHGGRVGIISNHLSSWFDDWFQRFSLGTLFQEPELVLVSSRAASAKPDVDIYKQFLAQSGLQPSDCIFVDDKQNNVEAAQSLGFRGVKFRHIGKDGSLKQTAEELLQSLRDCGLSI